MLENEIKDTSRKPLVTICTPCYNHEQYLDDYFQGIINQTYKNIELIITDDCSSDSSREIIAKWIPVLKKRLKNIVYIENESNCGITKTCNEMFKLAKGKYIKDVASDDVLPLNSIGICVDFMQTHPDVTLVVGNSCQIKNDYHFGDHYDMKKLQDTNYLNHIEDLHHELLKHNIINAGGAFYRDTVFEKYGYYDEEMLYEDWDYWLTVSKAEKIYFIDDVVYLYRESVTSVSHLDRVKDTAERDKRFYMMYENTKKIIAKHIGELPEKERKTLTKEVLLDLLYRTLEGKMEEYTKILWSDIKNNGVSLNSIEKLHCWLARYGLPLLKFKRRVCGFIKK